MNFPVPVVHLYDRLYALELFQGPTLAFKDFGARFMSRVMGHFLEQQNREINILVATSGDTGSAVAQGFFNVPGIKVTILYPKGKVSLVQEQQLTTNGGNITALEVDGTFDDCQRMVKSAFLDADLRAAMNLSSANSINIARLIPQSFYYFYAYGQVRKLTDLPVVFCTPSGNFGNLCGGLIAFRMGLPVHRFVAATNTNAIVPEYLKSGKFDPKPSVQTLANAMDVGNPSNFPRLLDLFSGQHAEIVKWVNGAQHTDEHISATIKAVYDQYQYTLCPHSAIGYQALKEYQEVQSEKSAGIFLATAHPAKFADTVERATHQPLVMPERLAALVQREKKAISMKADFEELKGWLLG
jgi:threonine synthase